MALVLNDDQRMLKQTAAEFVRKQAPVSRVRQLRDSGDELGFSRELWAHMAELGWPAIPIPEEYGGLGMGFLEMACVLEECGRVLAPEPLISSVLLGGGAVVACGNRKQKEQLLPGVADGSLLLALAYHERGMRYDVGAVSTRAVSSNGGYRLSGEKALVWHGHAADTLIVSARIDESAELALFVVPADAPGVSRRRQWTMHLRPAALVTFDDVEVEAAARLGEPGDQTTALEHVIDGATVGLCAEMLGAAQAAAEMTLEYLKTREQFGVPIGSFQALKHRAAKLFIETELARSALLGACEALDQRRDDAAVLVSVAKAQCSDAAVLAGYEGIQMHGGIGMTDEHDIGLFAKRVRGDELTFGDAAYHRDRFARLAGF